MRLLKISTFGVSNGVSPRKPQNCQQLLRSTKVTEVLQAAYTHDKEARIGKKKPTKSRRPQNHAAWERPNYVSSLHTTVHCSPQWFSIKLRGFPGAAIPKCLATWVLTLKLSTFPLESPQNTPPLQGRSYHIPF